MTRGRISQYVGLYRRRLKLLHWQVEIEYGAKLRGTRDAEIRWEWSYDRATLALCPEWSEWSDDFAEQIVAHELIHLLLRDLEVCVDDTFDHLPKEAQPLARDRWRHEVEGVTERLAMILTKGTE